MERAGQLTRRVELWRKTASKNTFGELTETWTFNKWIRAYSHVKTGSQVIDNDEVFDISRLAVIVRNQTDMVEMDRLKIDGRFYTIELLQLDDTKRWIHLRCNRINE